MDSNLSADEVCALLGNNIGILLFVIYFPSFLLYSAAATACMESISQNGNIWNVEIVYKQNRIFCTDREKAVTL